MSTRFLLALSLAAVGLPCVVPLTRADDEIRYLAVFADGARVEGKQIHDWQDPNRTPRLDSTNLLDPNRPLRWIRDLTLAAYRPRADWPGCVEFVGGDRLPGRVIGFQQQASGTNADVPAHLLVKTGVPLDFPSSTPREYVRVLAGNVRRVVWQGTPRRPLQPGTLFYRDGRRLSYRSLRWGQDAVSILAEEGVRRVEFAQMAEIHLPRRDPWKAYYEELAVLSPDGSTRLMRLETTEGLIATSSAERFRATSYGGQDDRKNWYHMVQPAWSLDPLWVRFEDIRTWHGFAPHEVPLSRWYPVKAVQRSILGRGWHWQADGNVQGEPLHSGGREHGWGFGVHAANELWFQLPDAVRGFQSRVGLDRIAGSGGCARAAVYVNQPQGNPLYRSQHLIGSDQVLDLGTQWLSGPAGGQRSLVLVTEAAERDRPPGTDPLDIRDMVDWIEPVLLLDPGKLKREVEQALPHVIPAWGGWGVSFGGGRIAPLQTRWDESDPKDPRCVVDVATGRQPLTLSMSRQLSKTDNWLLLHLGSAVAGAKPGRIEVRVDGRPIARIEVPPPERMIPMRVPLSSHQDRQVKIEVVYLPEDEKEQLQWRRAAIVERVTRVRWVTLQPVLARSSGGSKLKIQDDGSVLVEGRNPPTDTYVVTAKTDLADVTALRLEALPDASLPQQGPGRSASGNFILSQLSVGVARTPRTPLRGRYVRIELPDTKATPLSLAEVQVFSGSENVALGGKATQSTTEHNAGAERAIDNNTNGDFYQNSVSHTASAQDNPWWELELAEVKPIDCIVIFNRTDGFQSRLSNFRVSLLDADRKTVWQKKIADPPLPKIELLEPARTEIPLVAATADFAQENHAVADLLDGSQPTERGWAIYPQTGRPHVAVFTAEQPVDARDAELVFELRHVFREQQQGLGRFRLSITSDKPPIPAEPVAVDVPLLPP